MINVIKKVIQKIKPIASVSLAHKCGRLHFGCKETPQGDCDVESLDENHSGSHHCGSCGKNF